MSKLKAAEVQGGDRLSILYVRVRDARRWDRNPKLHDMEAIKDSIRRYGFRDAPIWDDTLDALPAGNGRTHALYEMEAAGEEPPLGVLLEEGTGFWCMPLQVGINARSKLEAEAFGVDHNNLTTGGSGLTALEVSFLWSDDYPALLAELKGQGDLPVSIDDDDMDAISKARKAPSLQEIEESLEGEDVEDQDFWPTIHVKVRPEIFRRYQTVMQELEGRTEGERFARLLEVFE
jgi:hypothetical protein